MAKVKFDIALDATVQIWALLNGSRALGGPLGPEDITISAPSSHAGVLPVNSKITLTRVPTSTKVKAGGVEPLERHYHRIPLSVVTDKTNPVFDFADNIDLFRDKAKVVEHLNGEMGTAITVDEISIPEVFPTPVEGVLTLPVTVNSYTIFGTTSLRITDNAVRNETLDTYFPADTLNGFDEVI